MCDQTTNLTDPNARPALKKLAELHVRFGNGCKECSEALVELTKTYENTEQ